MNVSTTDFSTTQILLAWTLLVLLLSWCIIFTALAMHDYVIKKVEWEDMPTPSRPIPIIGVLPKEEHQNFVEMAGGSKRHERTNLERSSDNGTSLLE
jgi:hypothetical protein